MASFLRIGFTVTVSNPYYISHILCSLLVFPLSCFSVHPYTGWIIKEKDCSVLALKIQVQVFLSLIFSLRRSTIYCTKAQSQMSVLCDELKLGLKIVNFILKSNARITLAIYQSCIGLKSFPECTQNSVQAWAVHAGKGQLSFSFCKASNFSSLASLKIAMGVSKEIRCEHWFVV